MNQQLMLRLIDEKPTECEVECMAWSPRMDILALSYTTGSVSLNRINSWQRIWAAQPCEEGRRCRSLAWRPDGKLLAAGDSGGLLTIRHIERSDVVHSVELDSAIVTMGWQHTDQSSNGNMIRERSKKWDFLAKLPSLSKTFSYSSPVAGGGGGQEELEDCRKLDSSDTSVLVVATQAGTVYVLINGYLLCMKLSVAEIVPSNQGIKSAKMTPDLKTLSVVVATEYGGKVIVVNCPIVSSCKQELLELASLYCLIHGLMLYTQETIKQIQEAWETILLEMDTKLSEYADNNPPGTVAADFLELLMFGIPSPQLKNFLQKEMSVKTLKKMGQSNSLSYSNIQRLVLSYLGAVSQSLNFQLWELLGVARVGHKYSVLGLTETLVETALSRAQSFWAKGYELQQVIDDSMKNFKAFFKWIYVEMLRLDDEPINVELSKVSQQEITFIAEFLQRFQPHDKTSGVSHVYLEKVGQYLKEEDLLQPVDRTDSPWYQLLESNPDLASFPFIIPHNSKTSLVKEHMLLDSAITEVFANVGRDLTSQSEIVVQHELADSVSIDSIRQFVDPTSCQGLVKCASQDSADSLLYWRLEPGNHNSCSYCSIQFDESIVDAIFYYTKDRITLLTILTENSSGVQTLVQWPVTALSSYLTTDIPTPRVLLADVSNVRTRVIENLPGCKLDACGYRNVSAILFKNKKRVRIYDMEGEEEEDEDEYLGSSGLSSSQLG